MPEINLTEISTERLSDDFLSVNSCGIQEISEHDRGSVRRGGRVDYHILYVARGICRLTLNGERLEVPAGNVILFRPGEPQEYFYRAEDKSVSHYIHFTGTGVAELLERLGIGDIRVFDMGISGTYEEVSEKMVREFTMKRQFYESWCAAYLHQLLILIGRKYALRYSHISRSAEHRINDACRRIYENLPNPPSAEELASECCLSVSRFTHLFAEVTGKSVVVFTQAMRIDRARELLSATDLSVREVAEAVGYADQNYFSRLFKKLTGKSPRDIRRGD
ncbi:MAG: helix-turn-helix domain-containing protein [Clostridia bacterium]|nr:helix-turn-helix domain-containing protein [Clostridia bacterium]